MQSPQRSRHLAEILTVILLHPDVEYTLSELAATLGMPLTTVQREVTRLSSAQLVRERRVGRSRLVSADMSSRYARPLAELVTLAFGPHFVIGEEFRPLDAVAVAMITPGPVVITVAFIGYLVAGPLGGAVAALGVFLPCYLFVVIPARYFRRSAHHPQVKAFVEGVTLTGVKG